MLYAIGTTVNDVIYVKNFLHELKLTTDNRLTPHIYTSSSAKCLTQQLGLAKRTKHIDIRYLHVQRVQSDGEVRTHKVSTANKPFDLMTSYVEKVKIEKTLGSYILDYMATLVAEPAAEDHSTTTELITDPYRYNQGQRAANDDDLQNDSSYDSCCHCYDYVMSGGRDFYKATAPTETCGRDHKIENENKVDAIVMINRVCDVDYIPQRFWTTNRN
eukprot:5175296-Amphidinium_carterae.2